MSDVRFATSPVPKGLEGLVREFWHLSDPGRPQRGLPKPYVELVVSLRGIHWWRADPGAREFRYTTAWVTPVQEAPRYARSTGRRELVGARLEPWAAQAWLGPLPAGDGAPPPHLSSLIGREAIDLCAHLRAADDLDQLFGRFAGWLEARPGLSNPRAFRAAQSSIPQAQKLARASGTTPRNLRRWFDRWAGLKPKRWLLLHRIDSVLRDRRLCDPSCSLAMLAVDHGFADQAHLTREIRRFTGVTPGAFRERGAHYPPHMFPDG